MIKIILNTKTPFFVRYLKAECGVRYWEDAEINGVMDEDGTLTPCRDDETWSPTIDLETGKIENWPQGTVAKIHFKVCDDGAYALLNADREVVKRITGYVPNIMCPAENGFGDYVIMNIDGDGLIEDFRVDLGDFEKDDDDD